MSNNVYQDYLDETKKSDNVAMAAALSKAALNSAYGAAVKLESMGNDHPLKNVGKEVEIYVTRKNLRGGLHYVR